MEESKMVIGQRVRLNFDQNQVGEIIETRVGFSVGPMQRPVNARVHWDDPAYRDSGWLSPEDLTDL